jgi:hypothetical protein
MLEIERNATVKLVDSGFIPEAEKKKWKYYDDEEKCFAVYPLVQFVHDSMLGGRAYEALRDEVIPVHVEPKKSSRKTALALGIVGALAAAALGHHLYTEEQKRPYRQAGLNDEQVNSFLAKYPQQNGNSSWVSFAKAWANNQALADESFKTFKSLGDALSYLFFVNSNSYDGLGFLEEFPQFAKNYQTVLPAYSANSSLVKAVYDQFQRDPRISLDRNSLFLKGLKEYQDFELIDNNLTLSAIKALNNLTLYYVSLGKDMKENFNISDISNTIALINKDPIIYLGLSGEFPLFGRELDILASLVKANYTESEFSPYVTWALSKKGSIIVDLINQKSQAIFDPIKPQKDINFDIRENYGANSSFIELLEKRRNQIVKVYKENLWFIGLKPNEIVPKMNNSELNSDIALLHVSLPFTLFSGDDLKGNYANYLYPELIHTSPENMVLICFSNNIKAMDIFQKIFKDYETGKLKDFEVTIKKSIEYYGKFNKELSRDMMLLVERGSKIAKYGIISNLLGCSDDILQKYGLPGRIGHEEFRVNLGVNIGASVGVPVYSHSSFYFTRDAHGDVAPILLPEDYQKLIEVDSSPLVYDPLTQATGIDIITRKNANYFVFLTGKRDEPHVKTIEITTFPIPMTEFFSKNFYKRIIFQYEK